MTTRDLSLFTAVAVLRVRPGSGDQSKPDPKAFETHAVFSIDKDAMTLTSVAATIEPRSSAPGYSWLRINFYAFPFTAADIAGAMKGHVESMDAKWTNTAAIRRSTTIRMPSSSSAWIRTSKCGRSTCPFPVTPARSLPMNGDVKSAVQEYRFDGTRLRLKSKGSFVCDIKSLGGPEPAIRLGPRPRCSGVSEALLVGVNCLN